MTARPKRKITPTQRAIIALLIFLAVLTIGFFVMLLAGKMFLPV